MTNVPITGTIGLELGGRYRLDALIGRGGMAAVYRAYDLVLGREVAVKLFRSDATDTEDIKRQEAEVRLLAALNHPGLAMLIDAGVDEHDDGHPRAYVVMQLVDGEDLRTRLLSGPLPPDEVAHLGAELAEALEHIHARGIVHRDIKPANILLSHEAGFDTRTHPKLTDFGIARLAGSTRLTATGVTIGTANYLSPEQAKGEPVDTASDLYSLGLVLLECLTGEQAFPGSAVESAIARVVAEPRIPPSVDERWSAIIRALTAKEPDARPTAHDLVVALRGGRPLRPVSESVEPPTVALEPVVDGTPLTMSTAAPPANDADTAQTERTMKPVAGQKPKQPDQRNRAAEQPAPADGVRKHRARRKHLVISLSTIAVVLAAGVAAGMLALTGFWTPGDVSGPDYPDVGGTVGTQLERLQEAVEP